MVQWCQMQMPEAKYQPVHMKRELPQDQGRIPQLAQRQTLQPETMGKLPRNSRRLPMWGK